MDSVHAYRLFRAKTKDGISFVDVANASYQSTQNYIQETTENFKHFVEWIGEWKEVSND